MAPTILPQHPPPLGRSPNVPPSAPPVDESLLPSWIGGFLSGRSLPSTSLFARQQPTPTATIPGLYATGGPEPGAVAGIVLGSVGGFVLLLWLIYTCINMGNPDTTTEGTASVVTRKSYRRRHDELHREARRRSRSARRETVEVHRRGGGGIIVEEVVGASVPVAGMHIVEERRRSVSRGPATPRPRRVVSDDEEDEIMVIEEHSSPERRRERSRVRSVERRSSGYREVDPERYAGGNARVVEVRRSSSSYRG